MRTAKTLIRLGGCPGWSESSLGAHAMLLVLSWMAQIYSLCNLKIKFREHWVQKLLWSIKLLRMHSKMQFRKKPKYSDTRKICCNYPKRLTVWFYDRVMHPKDADKMANSVDLDQTAPLEQSDLGLHCLARPAHLKTYDHYGKLWSKHYIERSILFNTCNSKELLIKIVCEINAVELQNWDQKNNIQSSTEKGKKN